MTHLWGKTTNTSWKKKLDKEVEDYEKRQLKIKKRRKEMASKGMFGPRATTECSQCKRKMDKHMADQQIENKRELAPICMACILGYKRKSPPKKYIPMKEYYKK